MINGRYRQPLRIKSYFIQPLIRMSDPDDRGGAIILYGYNLGRLELGVHLDIYKVTAIIVIHIDAIIRARNNGRNRPMRRRL